MSPEQLGAGLVDALGPDVVVDDVAYGVLTADVPATRWVDAFRVARDRLGCTYFDWLSAVDELEGLAVVAHLFSVEQRHHLQLRARIGAEEPRIASVVEVFRGADWHERETHEMFGVVFEGHPNLVPLLLPDGFSGHPLRKDFVLASRAAKPWPGAKEPGESGEAPSRRATLPPGVPAPGTWPAPPAPVAAEPVPPQPAPAESAAEEPGT